jgi:predicted transcriptional regulator
MGRNPRNETDESEITIEAMDQILPDSDKAMLERPDALIVQLDKDPWAGLTDRQKKIQEMYMRGMSQSTMAKLFQVSQPMIAKELKNIRRKHAERGVAIDKNSYAGETISIYEELFSKALRTFYEIDKNNGLAPQMRLQAINTMATLREKQTKLLMDLGIIDKTPHKVEHSLKENKTFVDNWSAKAKEKLAENLLEADFPELDPPSPPDIEEGDIVDE